MSDKTIGRRKKTMVIVGILAAVLTLGLVGTVVAKQRGYGCEGGRGPSHGFGFGPQAIEELGLSAEETANIEGLREKAMAMRQVSRDAFSAVQEAFETERNADTPNLRAVVEQARGTMDGMRAQREALMDEGLALYETLSPEQQRKVMDMLQHRFARFGHGGHHRRHGWNRDRYDDDDDGSEG